MMMISSNVIIKMLEREDLVLTALRSPNSQVFSVDMRTKHSIYLITTCELTIV